MTKLLIRGGTVRVSPKQGKLIIPEGVSEIPDGAFYRSVGIKEIVFPSSLEKIGDKAFASCRDLEELSIPPSVKSVGGAAFAKCVSLRVLKCSPASTSFSYNAFSGCERLREIYWGEEKGYCFYIPKNNQFIVTEFLRSANGVNVYGGRYAYREFPSGGPVKNDRYLYVATSRDAENREHVYFNTNELDAIQGVFMSANGKTIKENFGALTEDTETTPHKLGIMCGFCDVGVRNMCAATQHGYDDPVTIKECLTILGRFAPGAFRRLAYVLEHQDDRDNIRDIEYYLSDFESMSKKITESESLTWGK